MIIITISKQDASVLWKVGGGEGVQILPRHPIQLRHTSQSGGMSVEFYCGKRQRMEVSLMRQGKKKGYTDDFLYDEEFTKSLKHQVYPNKSKNYTESSGHSLFCSSLLFVLLVGHLCARSTVQYVTRERTQPVLDIVFWYPWFLPATSTGIRQRRLLQEFRHLRNYKTTLSLRVLLLTVLTITFCKV
ncbi:hypothetical protein CDAR_165911 [Caerostris darwini]|uniref:Uncharacterized protein n=1 Tax=Caerostris darwini TaxID=1538125 RepID=A0AAV4RU08_9ARAC|nr:hypothetical protein CDAR_165911 [Caerostris darwini]